MGDVRRVLAWILVGSLMARLAYVLAYPQQPVAFDAAGYDNAAVQLLATGDHDASGRGPVYIAFLAVIYGVFGHSYPAVRAVQAVLVSVTAVCAFLIGRALFGDRQGVAAGGLVSAYPGFFAYSGLLLTEVLTALVVAVFAWCFVQAWRTGSARWAAAAGLTLGVAALCRAELLGLGAVAPALLLLNRASRARLRGAAALAAAAAVVVGLWAMYERQHEAPGTRVGSGLGATLWLSTYPGEWLEWYPDREPLRSLLECDCTPEERSALLLRESWRNVAGAPLQYGWMSAKRFVRFWVGSHSGAVRGLETSFRDALASGDALVLAAKALLLALNLALIATAAVGWHRHRASWASWAPLVMVIAYVNLVHVLLFSTSRYQIPVMPLIAVLAACAADRVSLRPVASELT